MAVPTAIDPWPAELTPFPVFMTVKDSRDRQTTKTFALQVTAFPNTKFKTPGMAKQLYGKAALQLGLGVIASVIGAVYCPPLIPGCWQFTTVVAGALITPGMYDLLAAMDPPDPNFTTIVQPQVHQPLPRVRADAGLPPALSAAANQIAANAEQRLSLADAFRLTVDKAQGAIQAGDQCWASAQLHTAERYAHQLADLTAGERQLRTSLHGMLSGVPQLSVSAAALQALQGQIATTGFPGTTDAFLTEAGVDDLTKRRLHYLLQHSQVDLASYAGSYGYDAIGAGASPASPEDELAWREFAEARGSAQYACADAGLTVGLNGVSFSAPAQLSVTARLFPPPVTQAIDAYIAVRFPTGQFLSLQEGGGVVPGVVPFLRNFAPYAFDKSVLTYTFNGSEPLGTYIWYSALTQAGTLNLVAPLRTTQFTVR